VWFRRGRLFMVSPDSLGTACPLSGRNSTYRSVQISETSSNYIRTVRRWVKKEGRLTLVDKQQRVLPWWRVDANGSYVFFVRLGSKTIEFEKGKNAIAVRSIDKIPFIINILITAVRNGELDDQLAPAKKPVTAVTTRKAA
jgi:hypothetical protein